MSNQLLTLSYNPRGGGGTWVAKDDLEGALGGRVPLEALAHVGGGPPEGPKGGSYSESNSYANKNAGELNPGGERRGKIL